MKIGKGSTTSTTYTSANKAYAKAQSVPKVEATQDSFEVSESGSLFQTALDAMQNVPDIRAEPVAKAQQEIREGRYHRDERAIAEKIIDEHITSSLPSA